MLIPLLCLVTLSAYGINSLLGERDELKLRGLRRIALAASATLFALAALVMLIILRHPEADGSAWRALMDMISRSGESLLKPSTEIPAEIIRNAAMDAAWTLLRSMVFIACGAGLIALTRLGSHLRRYLFPPVALLILADLLGVFMPMQRSFDEPIVQMPREFQEVIDTFPYPPRILNPSNTKPNVAMHYEYSSP